MTIRQQMPKILTIDGEEHRKFRSYRKKSAYDKNAEKYKKLGYSVNLHQRDGRGRRYMYIGR